MRRVAFFLAIVLSLSPGVSTKTKSKKLHGYVTNIVSTTTFEVEDYRITHDLTEVEDEYARPLQSLCRDWPKHIPDLSSTTRRTQATMLF